MDELFRVDLESYRGPMELLLHLVRKHELDINDLPMARITQQFIEHLEVLRQIDINAVGDFLEMASILVEIKSRHALPRVEDETDEEFSDPRDELVQRLLEYKRIRDAAGVLDDMSRQWQNRFRRQANDLPPRRVDPADQPIEDLETWDLVSAFGRVMREHVPPPQSNIVYDDTPITTHMERIHNALTESGRTRFSEWFEGGAHKSSLIGIFLAILELVRHHSVRVSQEGTHGEIWIVAGENFQRELDLSQVDHYDSRKVAGDKDPAAMVDP